MIQEILRSADKVRGERNVLGFGAFMRLMYNNNKISRASIFVLLFTLLASTNAWAEDGSSFGGLNGGGTPIQIDEPEIDCPSIDLKLSALTLADADEKAKQGRDLVDRFLNLNKAWCNGLHEGDSKRVPISEGLKNFQEYGIKIEIGEVSVFQQQCVVSVYRIYLSNREYYCTGGCPALRDALLEGYKLTIEPIDYVELPDTLKLRKRAAVRKYSKKDFFWPLKNVSMCNGQCFDLKGGKAATSSVFNDKVLEYFGEPGTDQDHLKHFAEAQIAQLISGNSTKCVLCQVENVFKSPESIDESCKITGGGNSEEEFHYYEEVTPAIDACYTSLLIDEDPSPDVVQVNGVPADWTFKSSVGFGTGD